MDFFCHVFKQKLIDILAFLCCFCEKKIHITENAVFVLPKKSSKMAEYKTEIICEPDQKISKLKSYKQLRENSKTILSSEQLL